MNLSTDRSALTVIAFTGPETLPLLVGEEQGFFAAERLAVRCEPTPGSVFQMVGLIDGRFPIASTAIDNVIAYVEGQGAAETERPADLIVLMASATEPRPLMAAPGIASFTDLKGKRIAVDALGTGFSFMLRQVLEDYGLGIGDYELVPVGNVAARWQAVAAGDCIAGLLSKEYAAIARDGGCGELVAEPDPWDNYQGAVYTAQRSWAEAHRNQVHGFIRGVLRAVDWILEPDNLPLLPEILMRHLPGMSPAAAAAAGAELQSPRSVLKPGMPLDPDGIRTVLELRRKYGTPPAALGEPEKYLDLSFYDEAVVALR